MPVRTGDAKGKRRRATPWRKIAIAAVVLAVLAGAWRYTPLKELLTAENIRAWARAVRELWWTPIALMLAYTPASVVMIPRPILTLFAIVAFGVWLGLAYAAAGIMVAAMATYYAGRFMSEKRVRRFAGEALEPAVKVLRNHGIVAIFALNQVPVPPFAVQGLIAGGIRVNAWHYALGSFLGILPALGAWTIFGDQVAAALEGSGKISWWLIALGIIVLAGITYLVRRWFAKHSH